MKNLQTIAWILVIVGGVNWGLVGLGNFLGGDWNLVGMLLGSIPMLESLVYVLVGVSAVYQIVTKKKSSSMGGSMM